MNRSYRIAIDPKLYSPEIINQSITVINALSPLDLRGGLAAYADACCYYVRETSSRVFACLMDIYLSVHHVISKGLVDFNVIMAAPCVLHFDLHIEGSPMTEITNEIIMLDATPWIDPVEELILSLHENTRIKLPVEMLVNDTIDVVTGFRDWRLSFDSVDYFLQCLEMRDNIEAPYQPVNEKGYPIIEDRVQDCVREASNLIGPHIEGPVTCVFNKRKGYNDSWITYRVSPVRFVIEVGDGSQTIQKNCFSPMSVTRRNVELENTWPYQSLYGRNHR